MKRYLGFDLKLEVKALLVLLWAYGIRIGEALKVHKHDLFEDQEYLYLDSTPEKNPNQPRRVLPLILETPFLSTLIEYRDSVEGILFRSHQSTYWRAFHKVDETLCAHRFRHNRITRLALDRHHPLEIQSWAGHKNFNTTLKYIHDSGVFAEDLGKKIRIKNA